ncbi:MAG: methylated-DNA--[protein]-cysteine S-methyltransferase [Desulfovibrio sp.]|jgi:methylated-DNA-[protein]-cysteine S-methyltransferase|nr:methylated-DNA--[protein]-cysteine S-methyltransferase [Desulfovibrio sp.]
MRDKETLCACRYNTPLGGAVATAKGANISGFWFIGQKYFPRTTIFWTERPDLPVFISLRLWLESYFAGANPALDIAVTPDGTPFQKMVWDILKRISYGKVRTYGSIAGQIAASRGPASMSAQAVGGAVGRNPVSLLIPCHRVIASDGSLAGYAGGIDKKKALLRLEQADFTIRYSILEASKG